MKHLLIAGVALSALTLGAACGSTNTAADKADQNATSTKADEATDIAHLTWAEVEAAMANGAILVDARGADSYTAGHIAGAVNIPAGSDDPTAWGKLPSDKNVKVITYCGGPSCSASLKAAKKCKEMGYSDVAEYKGGYPEWKKTKGAAE